MLNSKIEPKIFKSMKKNFYYLSLVLSIMLSTIVFASCGGSENDNIENNPSTKPSSEEPDASYINNNFMISDYLKEYPEYSYFKDIIEHAASSDNSSTSGSLMDLLSSDGHYTLFLPDNNAIKNCLNKELHMTLENLLTNRVLCDKIVRTHLVTEKYLISDMSIGVLPTQNMLQRNIEINQTKDEQGHDIIVINKKAKIIFSQEHQNKEVLNGVIYCIDAVITDFNTLLEVIEKNPNTRTYVEIIKLLGYADHYIYSMNEYAIFTPTDNDYFFYIDPASIIRKFDGSIKKMYALKFTYEPNSTKTFKTYVQRYEYNPTTHALTIDPTVGKVSIGEGGKPSYYATQIQDMLNYHTVVLDGTPGLVGSHYYLTKHGATVYVGDETASQIGLSTVQGPLQIGVGAYPASKVIEIFDENNADARITNGTVYRLDSPIQPAIHNTYDIISDATKYPNFRNFFELVRGFSSSNLATDAYLTWCGILNNADSEAEKRVKKARYIILDDNNRMAVLGTYNYTIYVPENMTTAFNNGLGNWDKVEEISSDWEAHKAEYGYNTEDEAKELVKKMINGMRSFILYHIQNNSVYKDDNLNTSSNETLYTNDLGIAKALSLVGVGSDVYVKDAVEGRSTIEYPKMTKNSNILVRDISVSDEQTGYDESNTPFTYKSITSSSFIVIHGIDKPLCYNKNGKY